MKRSEINKVIREAEGNFKKHGWILPPNPRWDVTDFGLDDFERYGLVLVNLAEQLEYCEKVMYIKKNQITPTHFHKSKKEDIICRWGRLAIKLSGNDSYELEVNGEAVVISPDEPLILTSGERITLTQNVPHMFWAESDYVIAGEVSTANDDANDNFFADDKIGRFSDIEEDEEAIVKLVSE